MDDWVSAVGLKVLLIGVLPLSINSLWARSFLYLQAAVPVFFCTDVREIIGEDASTPRLDTSLAMSTSCPGAPVRIVVADDFPPFREALRKLFGEFTALEVVGEAADGNSAIEITLDLVPEVIALR
jgi:hypothetical protein